MLFRSSLFHFCRKRVRIALIGLSSFAAPIAAQTPEAYPARTLSPAEATQDVALLRQALEQVHAGYERYTPRRVMDAAFAKLELRTKMSMTDLELYRQDSN